MKKIALDETNFLIQYNDKYYVVNAFTKKLFEALEYTNKISDLASILDLSEKKVKKAFLELNNNLNNCEFYEKNLFLKEPIKLQWKITPLCNLRCKHCYLGDLTINRLSDEQLLSIADTIANSNIMELTITGGEALTVSCLPQILEKILAKNIKVHIFTNGILLADFVKKLPNYAYKDKLSFEVSVDGDKADHENIRGKGTFDKTLKGIKKAVSLGYSVSTNTVLSKLNHKSVPNLFLQLAQLNLKNIQISNLIDSGRASADMKLTEDEHVDFLNKIKDIVSKKGGADKLLYASQSNSFIYSFDGQKDTCLGKEKWKCGAGIGRATIDYKGNVYCCPFWEKSYMGSILEDTLPNIWQSKNKYLFLKRLSEINTNSRVCIVAKERVCND